MIVLGLFVLSVLMILATAVPLLASGWKWIRVFDFPRLQIAALTLVVLAADLAVLSLSQPTHLALIIAIALALVVQCWHIFPYTPLAPVQAQKSAGDTAGDNCLRLLISNVRMENRDSDRLLEIVVAADPDIAFFVETNDWWDRALAPLADAYPFSIRQPQENFYGMVLYSKLPIDNSQIQYLVDENVPSIHAEVTLRSGQNIIVRGLHPVPPPLADTYRRDAEILRVGRLCETSYLPNVVIGDLNDVGWSFITRLFVRTSGLVDPRVGRGLFASYHADIPLLRWPLDHIFHDPAFTVHRISLLPNVGSDHFPVFAELCYQPAKSDAAQAPSADPSDRTLVSERINEGLNTTPAENEYPPTNSS